VQNTRLLSLPAPAAGNDPLGLGSGEEDDGKAEKKKKKKKKKKKEEEEEEEENDEDKVSPAGRRGVSSAARLQQCSYSRFFGQLYGQTIHVRRPFLSTPHPMSLTLCHAQQKGKGKRGVDDGKVGPAPRGHRTRPAQPSPFCAQCCRTQRRRTTKSTSKVSLETNLPLSFFTSLPTRRPAVP
jgi:hypothetical protein